MEQIKKCIRYVVCACIISYQILFSSLLKPCCRYCPSCSEYALTAINKFGTLKGCWLACCRVLRCHPWSTGGYDPI